MKRTLVTAVLAAAAAATPAAAAPTGQNVVYAVEAYDRSGRLAAACTFVADRWTADYGPTHVTAVAVATQPAAHTSIRCTISKDGFTYVDASAWGSGSTATIDRERHGTVPAGGLTLCVYAESQFLVDARPSVQRCQVQ